MARLDVRLQVGAMPQIFLCYAREDEARVRDVYRRLSALGYQLWMDKINLIPGQRWRLEIPRALRASDFVLVFLSQNSAEKRGYVQREFKLALDTLEEIPEGVIHTIPIRLSDCAVPDNSTTSSGATSLRKTGSSGLYKLSA